MTTPIRLADLDQARHLVAIGDIEARDVRDSGSASLLRIAFDERLKSLGDCTSCAAIDEGKFLVDQISELDCDWLDAPSAECSAHLY